MHNIGRTQLETEQEAYEADHEQFLGDLLSALAGGELEVPLSETQELELASELLEVANEQELEQFLGDVFHTVGNTIGQFIRSDTGQALGGILKDAAGKALPVVGRAIGERIAPGRGGEWGGRIAQAAGSLLGLELEGLSPQDQEFEAARQFVRFAGAAANQALQAPPALAPETTAHAAATAAAHRFAPGLAHELAPRGTPPQRRGHQRGYAGPQRGAGAQAYRGSGARGAPAMGTGQRGPVYRSRPGAVRTSGYGRRPSSVARSPYGGRPAYRPQPPSAARPGGGARPSYGWPRAPHSLARPAGASPGWRAAAQAAPAAGVGYGPWWREARRLRLPSWPPTAPRPAGGAPSSGQALPAPIPQRPPVSWPRPWTWGAQPYPASAYPAARVAPSLPAAAPTDWSQPMYFRGTAPPSAPPGAPGRWVYRGRRHGRRRWMWIPIPGAAPFWSPALAPFAYEPPEPATMPPSPPPEPVPYGDDGLGMAMGPEPPPFAEPQPFAPEGMSPPNGAPPPNGGAGTPAAAFGLGDQMQQPAQDGTASPDAAAQGP